MLFEKTIREKRISPFYLEFIASLIILCLVIIIMYIVITLFLYYDSSDRFFDVGDIHVPIFLVTAFFCVCVGFLGLFSMPVLKGFVYHQSKYSIKGNLEINDVILVDHDIFVLDLGKGVDTTTYLHLFFKEPLLLKGGFLTLPYGSKTVSSKPFQLNYPALRTIDMGYRKYQIESLKNLPPGRKVSWNTPIRYKVNDKYVLGNQYKDYYLYFTREKLDALNHLFALVDPPEFRMVVNEEAHILIAFGPIPGHEYSPEALECMKKINAMYP